MAKYKVEYDAMQDEITKTLTFMGKEYPEIWKEDNTHCDCALDALVDVNIPNLPQEIFNTISELTVMGEDEVIEALRDLSEYEESQDKQN